MEIKEKKSPFEPMNPVSPKNFEGREEIIDIYNRELSQSTFGNPRHFFIIGSKGIGKSSLADYLIECAVNKYNMIAIHVYNDGIHTIDGLVFNIIEQLLNKINSEKWSKKIINKLRDNVESVGLFGTEIKFKPKDELLIEHTKDNFDSFLVDLVSNFDDKKGLFIVVDDINGLSNTPEFAFWYKSFGDSLATNYRGKAPIAIMLTGYAEKFEALYKHNSSFNRLFKPRYLNTLTNIEVETFFKKIFSSIDIKINDDALKHMVHFSSGFPLMMQEIGEAIFWINESNTINEIIALKGIIKAGSEIGFKYLKPALDSSIRSEKYISIFNKLGEDYLKHVNEDYTFRKKDFIENLSEKEEKVFGDFLRKARQLGIIEFTGAKKSGHYKFTNHLYGLYFAISSLKSQYEL